MVNTLELEIEHEELLRKFAGDTELMKLIDYTINYQFKNKEYEFFKTKNYPVERDGLGVLFGHLITLKQVMEAEMKEGK